MKTFTKIKCYIILILTAIQFVSVAQNCKYDYDKEDPISGNKECKINIYYESSSEGNSSLVFYKNGSDFQIQIIVEIMGEQNFSIKEGSKLELKLADNKLLTLLSVGNASPTSSISGTSAAIRTSYSLSYTISKEQLTEIQNKGIVFIRTYLQNATQWYDYEMKDKKIEKTKIAAACMK